MKRTILLLIVAMLIVVPAFSGGEQEKGGLIEVDFYYALGGVLGELVEELVSEYNSMQDEVVINASFQGTYGETANKVMADLASKNHPSLAMVSLGNIPQFLDVEGLVVDMNKYQDDPELDSHNVIPALR